ncbi:BLUF domain-containing protein [Agitococcus lubricus]|uniref:FAD-dependent sensor of blue light n=1 Tax=Agitococcus lubricus TaxID=1077255 RepID=A0A2T5J3W9_9GAMM|nr:BLUF domain-containing protein [Agitococcus lubricus]PTQ91310.1 FAD-dependent sensor of blue light [Agitococcus lubricus]
MLVRLIYVSTAHEKIEKDEFRKILDAANRLNSQKGLTGMLAFNGNYFLQALEGDREEVNRLYNKLNLDERHHNLAVLKFEEIQHRQWSSWSMGFAAAKTENKLLFLKYSAGNIFNPYTMSGDGAEKLLLELTDNMIALTQPTPISQPIISESQIITQPVVQLPTTEQMIASATLDNKPSSNIFSRLFKG